MNIKMTIFFACVAMAIMSVACGSGIGEEPEVGQDQTPADTLAVTNPTDTIAVTDPEEDPVDEYVPWTGEIEPLSPELRPVLTIGKKWITEIVFGEKDDPDFLRKVNTNVVSADTVLSGVNAKVISECGSWPESKAFEREVDGKVYMSESSDLINWTFNGLLYDVMAQSADVIKGSEVPITVVSRGTIVLRGKTRRCVKVRVEKGYNSPAVNDYDYWVEGIGPLFIEYPIYGDVSTTVRRAKIKRLQKCYDGNELIYDYRDFDESLYNPTEILYQK